MDLNQTQVAYFIAQLIIASKYYGFSDADAATLSTFMNARYNTRCSPPIDGQLYSICLAKDCPLAAPSAECDEYPHVQPYGIKNAGAPSGTEKPVLPTTAASSGATSATAASASSSGLSGGVIAGISIGAAAVVLLAAGIFLFLRHQRKSKAGSVPDLGQPAVGSSPAPPPRPNVDSSTLHNSYYSWGPHDSYTLSTAPGSPPPPWAPSKPPQELGAETTPGTMTPTHQRPVTPQMAEMESPEPPPSWAFSNQASKPTN